MCSNITLLLSHQWAQGNKTRVMLIKARKVWRKAEWTVGDEPLRNTAVEDVQNYMCD
jgi:hypothetical protein